MLKLYNNLTQKEEKFVSIKDGKVGVYSCGPMRKIYKDLCFVVRTSSDVRFMLPGDLRVAGCFIFRGVDGRYFSVC